MPTTDENVTTDYAKAVCKIGQGAACCRYLVMSKNGWSCEKNNPEGAAMINARVAADRFISRGDNCEGRASR